MGNLISMLYALDSGAIYNAPEITHQIAKAEEFSVRPTALLSGLASQVNSLARIQTTVGKGFVAISSFGRHYWGHQGWGAPF